MKNNWFKRYSLVIIAIFIIFILILPGFYYFYFNNITYLTNSFTWDQNHTELAFFREDFSNKPELGELMVWFKDQNNFQSLGYIATEELHGCNVYTFAICIHTSSSYYQNIHLQFSPDDHQLALVSYYLNDYSYDQLTILIYNLTSLSVMIEKTLVGSYHGALPNIVWSNGKILLANDFYVDNQFGINDLLTNQYVFNYSVGDYPYSTPLLSHNGEKIALTTGKYSLNNNSLTQFNLLILDLNSKTIVTNITSPNPSFIYPYSWSYNDSDLLYASINESSGFTYNYSILNVNSNETTFTFNMNPDKYLYFISSDFKYLTIEDMKLYFKSYKLNYLKYYNLNLVQNTNTTIRGPSDYYTDPEHNLVYTGNNTLFKISTLPNLDTYYSIDFNESNRDLGFFSIFLGLLIIVIIVIYSKRKVLLSLMKK